MGYLPGKDVLKDGDILIDVTTYLNKFHGDTNKTFLVETHLRHAN